MNSKVILSILIFVINLNKIFGQLHCFYNMTIEFEPHRYSCHLTINNPNGLNNFQKIDGEHLPGYSDSDVEWIHGVSGSNTANFPSIICQKFRNIGAMSLWSIGIQRIDDYSFVDCAILRYLDFLGNPISIVSERAFSRNLDLWQVFFRNNFLTTLPENIFEHNNFTRIWLSNNLITDLPTNIFSLQKDLNELTIGNNPIENLKVEWFENLENLEYLGIHNTFISSMPTNIFSRLRNLYYINLDNNRLKTIHADSFGLMPRLLHVYFEYNQIDAIDENFIDNAAVYFLYMRGNLCFNGYIADVTPSQDVMRAELRTCFINFRNLTSGKWM